MKNGERIKKEKKWKGYPASSASSCINESTWFWKDRWDLQWRRLSWANNKKECESREMYLWRSECCCAAHGVLHMGCLNIQSFKLALKFVHEAWDLKTGIETLVLVQVCFQQIAKGKYGSKYFFIFKLLPTFSRFIDFKVASMPFTTPAIDFVTWKINQHH